MIAVWLGAFMAVSGFVAASMADQEPWLRIVAGGASGVILARVLVIFVLRPWIQAAFPKTWPKVPAR